MRVAAGRPRWWAVVLALLAVCTLETLARLGPNSPDTRYTLPAYSLGFFWDTPIGWTGLVGGVEVNRDSVQFASLASFLRNERAQVVPLADNVYTRFSGYALAGSAFAPLVGEYASFVLVNVVFWVAAAYATYSLAVSRTGSNAVAILAGLMVGCAPPFEALVGQALPYVPSYGLFALSLWLFDRVGLFDRDAQPLTLLAAGLAAGVGFLFYDLYMIPAFVVAYGVFTRMRWRSLLLVLIAMACPRLVWSAYWQISHLASYGQNEAHPSEALVAWLSPARIGQGVGAIRGLAVLAAHGVLNVLAAFLFWPVVLACVELIALVRARSRQVLWYLAVAIGGFAPAAFMLSTWPHIPRWYEYGFPAVYTLAASTIVRAARALTASTATATASASASARRGFVVAALLLLPVLAFTHLDLLGATRPMELVLFQPAHWSYLWSR